MPLPRLAVLRDADRPPRLDEIARLADVQEVSAADLHEALPGTEVLLAWDFRSHALAGAWEAADRLRWVHTASAGVDNVLTPAVTASEVTVTNSRGVFDAAIAEYVLGLVLMFAKDLGGTWERQRAREWRHRETERVAGATAVVVGVGPIGRATAALLGAAGMRVRAVGRTARTGDPDLGEIVVSSELAALLPDADYLVLAAPLTDETRGMLDGAALAVMKPSSRLINVGRGELVVEDDLVAALRDGVIGGAALDVFAREPLPRSSPLWDLPNVLVSPHMSADAVGWQNALCEVFLDNLRRWCAGRPLRNVVDKTVGYVRSTPPEE